MMMMMAGNFYYSIYYNFYYNYYYEFATIL